MKPIFHLLIIAVSTSGLRANAFQQTISAVTYITRYEKDPPMHLHLVVIDLTDPAMHVVVRRAGRILMAKGRGRPAQCAPARSPSEISSTSP